MTDDPIIAEIHRIRERIWEQCHGSDEEMAERQRQLPQDRRRLIDVEEWNRQRKQRPTIAH